MATIAAEELTSESSRARAMRLRIDLGNIDYARELHRLTGLGASQHDLASALFISQSGLAAALTAAHQVLPTRPGFSGASPYELCQRFAAGRLSRVVLSGLLGASAPRRHLRRPAGRVPGHDRRHRSGFRRRPDQRRHLQPGSRCRRGPPALTCTPAGPALLPRLRQRHAHPTLVQAILLKSSAQESVRLPDLGARRRHKVGGPIRNGRAAPQWDCPAVYRTAKVPGSRVFTENSRPKISQTS